jgi:hypothetical protein
MLCGCQTLHHLWPATDFKALWRTIKLQRNYCALLLVPLHYQLQERRQTCSHRNEPKAGFKGELSGRSSRGLYKTEIECTDFTTTPASLKSRKFYLYSWSLCIINRDISVGIAIGYRLDDRGDAVKVSVEARFFSSLSRSDRFWGQPSLLSNGYQGLFPQG